MPQLLILRGVPVQFFKLTGISLCNPFANLFASQKSCISSSGSEHWPLNMFYILQCGFQYLRKNLFFTGSQFFFLLNGNETPWSNNSAKNEFKLQKLQ